MNALHQYATVTNLGYKVIIGVALACSTVGVTNTITAAGGAADRKGEYFHRELVINNTTSLWQTVSVTSGGSVSNGAFVFPANKQPLTYDADGDLTFDGVWTYEWDAENRLKAMWITNIINDSRRLRLDFTYDYQNRRICKQVSSWDNSASLFSPQYTNRFLYDGWNTIATIDPQSVIQQSFTWGVDVSGAMDKAGGIGGLLRFTDQSAGTSAAVTYDGNGNITELINADSSSVIARYDYSPYGELLRTTGSAGAQNPIRWSTKFSDEESGLIYYGYRYLSPSLGRWLGRDPAGEGSSINLSVFVNNSPGLAFDPDGRTPQLLLALSKVGATAEFADFLFNYSSFTSFPGMDLRLGGMGGSYLDGVAAGLSLGIDVALGGRLLKNVGGPGTFALFLGLGGWMGVPKMGIARLNRTQSLAAAVVSGRLSAVAAIGDAARAQAMGAGPGGDEIEAAAYGFLQAARRGDTAYAELDAALLGAAIGREQAFPWNGGFTRANTVNAAGLLFNLLNGDAADAFSRLPDYQALNAWDMATEMEDFVEGW